jgi:hypothetical protein
MKTTDHLIGKRILFLLATAVLLLLPGGVTWSDGELPERPLVGESTHILINSMEQGKPEGVYRIQVGRDGAWENVGELSFNRFFRTGELELKLPDHGDELQVRIEKEGGGAAHIDSVFLNRKAPVWAKGDVLGKISQYDYDVINAHEAPVQVTFDTSGMSPDELILSLTARIEGEQVSEVPFQFPPRNTFREINEHALFYRYELGTNRGAFEPDGDIRTEQLGEPFFAEYIPVGSGHPQGTTYGWVKDDGENLYVAIDFTADNTMDGDADYTKVYVKTESGLQDYTVSVLEQAWGKPGFSATSRADYEHKTYEYRIPLQELGIDGGDGVHHPLELAFAAYGTAVPSPGDKEKPALVYDSNHNRFLLVYQYYNASNNYDIHGLFLDGTGAPDGSSFDISTATMDQLYPSVAFDPGTNRFLIAWNDDRGANSDIYGQLVNADGSLYGTAAATNFAVSTASGGQNNPSSDFDPNNNRFLVVWEDFRAGSDIYGQLVNADGSLYNTDAATNFAVSTALSGNGTNPSVGFDPGTNRFLVAWVDFRAGFDIYGQMVNADGSLYGTDVDTNFAISRATNDQSFPSVVYDPGTNRFLVAWEDYRVGVDIYGQLVNADGSLYQTDDLTNFAISTAAGGQYAPSVGFDPGTSRCLVAWHDTRDVDQDIYGQLVNADGSLYGTGANTNFTIADTAYFLSNTSVAANSFCSTFLTAYQWMESGIAYITTVPVGSCSPAQALLTFPIGNDNGVTPRTGSAGDTFTFSVIYWGEAAPQFTELWMDLDGDGSYNQEASSPAAPLPGGFPGTGIPVISLILVLSGISGLVILVMRRPRKGVCSAISLLFIVAFFSVGVLTGCGGEGGGEPVIERFAMTEADAADTNYMDGKLYTVDVTVENPGSVAYTFAFIDWNGSVPTGQPVVVRTVTVQ